MIDYMGQIIVQIHDEGYKTVLVVDERGRKRPTLTRVFDSFMSDLADVLEMEIYRYFLTSDNTAPEV